MTKEHAASIIEELYFTWYEISGKEWANKKANDILAMVEED